MGEKWQGDAAVSDVGKPGEEGLKKSSLLRVLCCKCDGRVQPGIQNEKMTRVELWKNINSERLTRKVQQKSGLRAVWSQRRPEEGQ